MTVASELDIQHIRTDENGVAWILGSNTKVIEVVRDHLFHGISAAEIHYQYPDLSLAQIHSALSYYFDHKAELDADIERRDRLAVDAARATGPSPIQERLLAEGRLQ